MFDILKEFPAHWDIYDSFTLWLNVAGGLSIALSFIILGLIFIIRTRQAKGTFTRLRVKVSSLIGWFLLSCGMSRAIDVLCLWDNLAILSGYIKLLTGVLASLTIYYLPALLKEASTHEVMQNVKEELKKTQETMNQVKDISEKL